MNIDSFNNPVDFIFLAFVIGITGVAIGASEIAAGQPDKNTRPARIRRLALDTVEYFVDL
jgi:hypothetical protein